MLEGEDKCRVEKPTRLRIGLKYSEVLPNKGFTEREIHNKKKWDAKSPAERELISTRLRNALKNHKDKVLNQAKETK